MKKLTLTIASVLFLISAATAGVISDLSSNMSASAISTRQTRNPISRPSSMSLSSSRRAIR
jgi:hypothetical protein